MGSSWSGLASDVAEIADEWRADRPARNAARRARCRRLRLARATGLLRAVVPSRWGACGGASRDDAPCVRGVADARSRPIRRWPSSRPCTRRSSGSGSHPPARTRHGPNSARRLRQRAPAASGGPSPRSRAAAATSPAPGRAVPDADAPAHIPARPTPSSATSTSAAARASPTDMITTAHPRGRGRADDLRPRRPGPPLGRNCGAHAASPSGTAWAWPRPRATRCASGAPGDRAWRGTARSTDITRPRRHSSPTCSPRWSWACSTRRRDRAGPARAEGRPRCAPSSRSSGRGPSRTTGSPCRRTRARSGRSRRAIQRSRCTRRCAAKKAVAELAEATLPAYPGHRWGTFSQRSPFARWFEDVRALGFLRPPWGLAYDGLFATSFA